MIVDQIAAALPAAILDVCAALPADFPEPIRDSVVGGITAAPYPLGSIAGRRQGELGWIFTSRCWLLAPCLPPDSPSI
jgi:hypothetical protein